MNNRDIVHDQHDENLDYSQNIRRQMATKLTEKGMPESDEGVRLMITLLDSMDRTSVSRKRIQNDSKLADAAAAEKELIARILDNSSEIIFSSTASNSKPIPLVERVAQYTPAPGEIDTGQSEIQYEDIFSSDKLA